MAFPTDGPTWASDDSAKIDVPSEIEIALGFGCGKASPGRFNWIIQSLQSTLKTLSAGNWTSQARRIDTTEGLKGGGDLSDDRTLSLAINDLETETTIDGGDLIALYDVSAGAHRSMTRDNFVQGLGGGGGLVTGGENVGDGAGKVYKGLSGGNIQLRSVKSGGGVSVSVVDDNIVVALADMGSALTFA